MRCACSRITCRSLRALWGTFGIFHISLGRRGVFLTPDFSGDVAHQANVARASFGVDGTGVKIGVLSDGVDSAATEKTGGRLPAVQVIAGQGGSGDEGTAMLEILYSLAPGATLYFATAGGGQGQMASNIQALADAGCQDYRGRYLLHRGTGISGWNHLPEDQRCCGSGSVLLFGGGE